MITVFCLCTYKKPITYVKPYQDGLMVLTGRQGLFGFGIRDDYIPVYVTEGGDIEKLRAEAHKTIDDHYDSLTKRSA